MADRKKQVYEGTLGKIYISILLIIFGGIVLHAPISVALGTLWPNYDLLIKSWKEILMLVAGLLALYLMYKTKKMKKIMSDPIILIIAAYATLHLLLLFFMNQGLAEATAGLAIDLRYVLFFALVYIAICLYPEYRKLFVKVGVGGAVIVLVFGLLQVFILPQDILKYIGYGNNTISPFLTIDENQAFIRINSTLRGPNPLGAYAGIILTLLTAWSLKKKVVKKRWPITLFAILTAGSVVALWASYSRSAQIGTAIALSVVLAVTFWRKLNPKMWVIICSAVILIAGGLFMVRNTPFISNVVLHENPNGGSNISSNEGHISSLNDSFPQLLSQPLGAGIGSTGSASLLGKNAEIIENQYLFLAHEVGWLGLALFVSIFVLVMARLWKLRKDWLALGVFASGVGLAVVGIFLPVWTDDTVAIIWWGLAGLAIGSWNIASGEELKAGRKSNAK
jgi:hypothetical protein